MKAFVKEFIKRGAMFCGGGPFIVAIIYMFILGSGEADSVAFAGLLGGEGRFGIVLPKANGANVVLAAGGKGFVPATGAGKFRHGF